MDASLEQRISAAYAQHQAGQTAHAEQLYRALLDQHPEQVDVLYLLSALLLGNAQPAPAAGLAGRALAAARGAGGIGVAQAALHDHYAACLAACNGDPALQVQHLQQAQQLDAAQVERLFRLAEAQRRAGDHAAAVATLGDYLTRRPDDLNARTNLGALLLQSGQPGPAIEQLQAVVGAQPGHLAALNNLGKAFEEVGRTDLAVNQYQQAANARPDDAEPWLNLADALHTLSRLDEAIAAYERAAQLAPDDWRVERGLNSALVKRVPRWHFSMMNDRPRNAAYERAISAQVGRRLAAGEAPLVLDIGAGSGLLSMMAARAGAPQVVACEMVRTVAETARAIIADNGWSERIRLHDRKSTSLTVGADLPRRADLLITEIFDVGLLAEYVLPVLAHARQELLVPGAQIIPARAQVWMMPVESTEIHETAFASDRNACGFALGRFNRFAKQIGYEQLVVNRFAYQALAEPRAVLDFDFSRDVPDRELIVEFEPTRSGLVHAWVFWFTLQLDADSSFDSGPFTQGSHWAQAVQIEAQPPALQAGRLASVKLSQSQTHIRFIYPAA